VYRHWSIRTRLTALYGTVFALASAAVLAITYLLMSASTQPGLIVADSSLKDSGTIPPGVDAITGADATKLKALLVAQADRQRADELHQLLLRSGLALLVMIVVAGFLGWLLAGRALRPVRIMTDTARRLSDQDLSHRIALTGPRDELRQLAETFDNMLDRLQTTFEAQRRFVANASHELRTPLAAERTTLEVAIADPQATTSSLRTAIHRVLDSNADQQRRLDALLNLVRASTATTGRQPVRLDHVLADAASAHQDFARNRHANIQLQLQPVTITGDIALLERLASNLIDNAIRYSGDQSQIRITTSTAPPGLQIDNSGPHLRADVVASLTEPFRRGTHDRASGDGLGLGLSLVAAIAAAHHAQLHLSPRRTGGLHVEIHFNTLTGAGRVPVGLAEAEPPRCDATRSR
jgi:signal transduction histidine kinase